MKLLIVANNLMPKTNANTNIVYRLADMLQQQYGDEILFLGTQTAAKELSAEQHYSSWQIPTVYQYQQKIPETLSKKEKVIRLLLNPALWEYKLRSVTDRYPLQRQYRKYLRQILRAEKSIDCVLCVSCPHDTLYAASRVVKKVPLASYQLDPWSTNSCYHGNPQVAREEKSALSRCAVAFVTREMDRERREGIFAPPLDRVIPLEFPNLIQPPNGKDRFSEFGKEWIHCAYVGQLYPESVRGPRHLFTLFRELEKYGIMLHVIGNSAAQAKQYESSLSKNIILHGRVSPKEAKAYMMSADILVNMGNTIPNMLPSKTIDYISCGKPILNLCKIPSCPTIPYMEKYGNALTIMEKDTAKTDVINRIVAFCKEKNGYSMSFAEVKELFFECTPEHVAGVIHKTLQEVIKDNCIHGE